MKNRERYREERKEVARFMRRLYSSGLTTTSGGNISLRVDDDTILITPSATDKGKMRWKEVGIMLISGENLTQHLKPSIESEMHLSLYRKRDIGAIIHAHPVFATTFTALKKKISTSITAEACAILGKPAFVPYALMGTADLASRVSEHVLASDILLLENHGILAVGANLLQAFDRIEVLENAAKMTVISEIMGGRKALSGERVNEIIRMFR